MLREKFRQFVTDRVILKRLAISGFLLLLWISLTVLYVTTFDTSFSIWSYNHPNSDIKNLNYDLFHKAETFKGEFVAQDNNLGIVAVRFETYIRPPYQYEDQLLFKLREKGAKSWYYQNIYRSGLVYDVPFFPFGFPQISNSKGKAYQFEITTLNTNAINKLSISNRKPILQSKYKYIGKELLHNKSEFIRFLIIKFSNAFKTPDVLFSSFIYLLPLLFYLVWISLLEKFFRPLTNRVVEKLENSFLGIVLKALKKGFLFNLDYFLIFIVLIDIFWIQLTNDLVYVVILILWIATLAVYKKDAKESFIIGITLITFCPFFLFFQMEPTAEKSGIWAFMFLAAGMIQILFEQKMRASKIRLESSKMVE